jgi:CheY-like chemotaxis protein
VVEHDSGVRVLVVDSVPAVRELLETVLRGAGHEVASAADGRAALPAALRWRPDVILVDVDMPAPDDAEFVRRYRLCCPAPVPIVVVTAAPDGATRAARLSAAGFLGKPFALPDLLEVVRLHAAPGVRRVDRIS